MLPEARVVARFRLFRPTAGSARPCPAKRPDRFASPRGARSHAIEEIPTQPTKKEGSKMKKVLLPALLIALLTACGSTRTTDDTAATGDVSTSATGATGISATDLAALNDPNSIVSRRSVYFDFDSFTIRQEFVEQVEAHAALMQANPQVQMRIQGNTDERGSREYNLALGQKRAEAVKRAIVLLGVDAGRVESVSLGEEKPRCSEATESCWGENRRADMLYSGEF